MSNRILKVVDLSENDASKTLQICFGESQFRIGFERMAVPGFENQWLICREDMDLIFGKSLLPYYAPLLAELAKENYVLSGFAIDLDVLDVFVAGGRSFIDAIQNAT